MRIEELLKQRGESAYRLSKKSGVPYTTLIDIISGRTNIGSCSGDTLYKLAKSLSVSIESLLEPSVEERPDFELFKSSICHQVKSEGDLLFIIDVLKDNLIKKYYDLGWYPECLYMLAMVDYLSRINHLALCKEYDSLRHSRLSSTIFPSSIIVEACVTKNDAVKERAIKESIPEFIRFNIVESEIRNVA